MANLIRSHPIITNILLFYALYAVLSVSQNKDYQTALPYLFYYFMTMVVIALIANNLNYSAAIMRNINMWLVIIGVAPFVSMHLYAVSQQVYFHLSRKKG